MLPETWHVHVLQSWQGQSGSPSNYGPLISLNCWANVLAFLNDIKMPSNAMSFGCRSITKGVSRLPTHMSDLNTSDNCWGTKTMPYTQTNCQVCTLETVGESTVTYTAVSISCLGQSHLSNSFNFNLINSWDSQYVYCVYVPPPKPDKFPCRKKKTVKEWWWWWLWWSLNDSSLF